MFLNKLKVLGAVLLTLGLLGSGVAMLLSPARAEPEAGRNPTTPGAASKADEKRPAHTAASDLPGLWADLASTDEIKAARAIALLTVARKESVPFLAKNLQPVKADPKRIAQLITDLDSDEFAVREKATNELEYLGKAAEADLKKALTGNPSAETRRRIEGLLSREAPAIALPNPPPGIAGGAGGAPGVGGGRGGRGGAGGAGGAPRAPGAAGGGPVLPGPKGVAPAVAVVNLGTPVLWLRAARAVMVLEAIDTPEARQVLEAVAQGEPDALPTKEAKSALERLGK